MVHCTLLSLYLIIVWVAFSFSCIDIVACIRLIEEEKEKRAPVGAYKDMNDNMITINVNFVQKGTL